jgi:hypothetical protein
LEPPATIPQMFATKHDWNATLEAKYSKPMELLCCIDPANLAGAGCATKENLFRLVRTGINPELMQRQ